MTSGKTLFDKSPDEKINDSIVALLDKNAPLGVMLYSTKFFKTRSSSVKDMLGNGCKIWINLKWLKDAPQDAVNLALLKVLTKLYSGQHIRMPKNADARTKRLWNIGCDLAVNSLLASENKLPEEEPVPGRGKYAAFKPNLSTEDYYLGVKEIEPEDDGMDQQGEPSANRGGSSGSGRSSTEQGSGQQGQSEGSGNGSQRPEAGGGSSEETSNVGDDASDDDTETPDGNVGEEESSKGSEQDGHGEDEAENNDSAGPSEDDESNMESGVDSEETNQTTAGLGSVAPPDAEDMRTAEGDWQTAVAGVNAAAANTGFGCSQGWLRSAAAESLNQVSRVSWRTVLKRRLTKVCNSAWNYNRLSRRHGWRTDIIMPNTREKTLHRCLMIVDSSGSMDDKRCALSLTEIEGIMKSFPRAEIVIMQCDTRVIESSIRTVTRNDFPITDMKWYGRGGTNLSPAFSMIKRDYKDVAAIIVLSDMEWNVADAPDPGIPTLWLDCSRDGHEARRRWLGDRCEIPFGRMLRVELDE
jgi:predicted metal-dependent peptidase